MDLFEEWVTADMNEDVTGPLSDTNITGGEESEPEVEPMPPAVMSCENEQDSDCEITSPTLPSPSEVIKMLQTSLEYFEKKKWFRFSADSASEKLYSHSEGYT